MYCVVGRTARTAVMKETSYLEQYVIKSYDP